MYSAIEYVCGADAIFVLGLSLFRHKDEFNGGKKENGGQRDRWNTMLKFSCI